MHNEACSSTCQEKLQLRLAPNLFTNPQILQYKVSSTYAAQNLKFVPLLDLVPRAIIVYITDLRYAICIWSVLHRLATLRDCGCDKPWCTDHKYKCIQELAGGSGQGAKTGMLEKIRVIRVICVTGTFTEYAHSARKCHATDLRGQAVGQGRSSINVKDQTSFIVLKASDSRNLICVCSFAACSSMFAAFMLRWASGYFGFRTISIV